MKLSKSFFWDPDDVHHSFPLSFAPARRRRLLNYVLVKVRPGYDNKQVAASIERATGLHTQTGPEFEKTTMMYILGKTGILINFGLAVGLGVLIGLRRRPDSLRLHARQLEAVCALKPPWGAGNWLIVRMMVVQVLIVALLGFGIGLGAVALMGKAIVATDLAFPATWEIIGICGVALLLICLVADLPAFSRSFASNPSSSSRPDALALDERIAQRIPQIPHSERIAMSTATLPITQPCTRSCGPCHPLPRHH